MAPQPPGMIRTSRAGAVVKVWVGRICWPTLWVPGRRVETGDNVSAMMDRVMSLVRERSFTTSIGPKASRASKPG